MFLPPGAAAKFGLSQMGGTPNPFQGPGRGIYMIAKVTPFVSLGIDVLETAYSCAGAAGL
jgi:hypothetical protein